MCPTWRTTCVSDLAKQMCVRRDDKYVCSTWRKNVCPTWRNICVSNLANKMCVRLGQKYVSDLANKMCVRLGEKYMCPIWTSPPPPTHHPGSPPSQNQAGPTQAPLTPTLANCYVKHGFLDSGFLECCILEFFMMGPGPSRLGFGLGGNQGGGGWGPFQQNLHLQTRFKN